jgi:hypothetical protein
MSAPKMEVQDHLPGHSMRTGEFWDPAMLREYHEHEHEQDGNSDSDDHDLELSSTEDRYPEEEKDNEQNTASDLYDEDAVDKKDKDEELDREKQIEEEMKSVDEAYKEIEGEGVDDFDAKEEEEHITARRRESVEYSHGHDEVEAKMSKIAGKIARLAKRVDRREATDHRDGYVGSFATIEEPTLSRYDRAVLKEERQMGMMKKTETSTDEALFVYVCGDDEDENGFGPSCSEVCDCLGGYYVEIAPFVRPLVVPLMCLMGVMVLFGIVLVKHIFTLRRAQHLNVQMPTCSNFRNACRRRRQNEMHAIHTTALHQTAGAIPLLQVQQMPAPQTMTQPQSPQGSAFTMAPRQQPALA